MKRKIFTLLVAFLALAAFHAKAHISGAEAPAILNVGGLYVGDDYANGRREAYPAPFNVKNADYSFIPPAYDAVTYPGGAMKQYSGYLSWKNGKAVYVPQQSGGQAGNLDDYFTLHPESLLGTDAQTRQYRFWSYPPKCTNIERKELNIDGRTLFEFVRFPSQASVSTVQSYYGDEGGYLCVVGASGGATNAGREMVVIDARDNTLHVVPYAEYEAHRVGGFGPGTNNYLNYPVIIPGSVNNNDYYTAIWLRASGITGRWARHTDFDTRQDFVQIKSTEGPLFEVEGINKFKVALTGIYTEWNQQSSQHNFGAMLNFDPAYAGGNPTKDSSKVDYNGFIQLFSLIAPERGNNLVTVTKNNNVFDYQASYGDNAYGNRLALLPPYMKERTSTSASNCPADTARQQFAIWVDVDGTMALYPLGAHDYHHGDDADHQPLNPTFRINNSIIFNAPKIISNYKIAANEVNDSWANYAYRIGFAEGEYVVGPSTFDLQTAFTRPNYCFMDVTKYNEIEEKRYFYLESTVPGRDGKPMVVDVVKEIINNVVYKKLVLTDREANRFEKGNFGAWDTTYYNTPYDSLNMSACWSVRKIYNTNYDHTTTPKMVVGYIFINEEGDTLQYAYNNNTTSLNWGGKTEILGDSITNALMNYDLNGHGNDSIDNSYVWKTLGFEGQADGRFFLMNMKGAAYQELVGSNKVVRDAKSMRPAWDIRIDTVRTWWSDCYPYHSPFDTTVISNQYFKSGTIFNTSNPAISGTTHDAERATFYPGTGITHYKGLGFSGRDSSVHRNLGVYDYDSIPRTHFNINNDKWDRYPYYDLENTFGLELRLAPIHVNADTTLAPHDSINPISQQYEWERYRVDSLWTYLNKVPGNYAIKEALGWSDIMRINDYDPAPDTIYASYKDVVFMGLPTMGKDVMGIMPVDSALISSLNGVDDKSATGVGQNDPTHNTHSYKWYNIYYVDFETGDTLYMIFDKVRPHLAPSEQQYGFKFVKTNKRGAGKFRFYQPIVADKEQEFFMIETQVPEFRYKVNGTDSISTGFTDVNEVSIAGYPRFAQLNKDSKEITVTADQTLATRWDFTQYAEGCRIDYIDNDFLAETKMYGAPLLAERYYTGDNRDPLNPLAPHSAYTKTFISNNGGSGSNNSPNAATEDSLKYAVTFTLVPAKVIEAHQYSSPNTSYYGTIKGYYGHGDASNVNSHFQFRDQNRDVQLYYVRQITRTATGSDTTFLSVTNQNVFYQTLEQQMNPSVAGEILQFLKYNKYNKVNIGGDPYENDSTLLQMFAVYGKLGTDEDRKIVSRETDLPVSNYGCITPADFEYHFGQFIFVPAASYIYDYQNKKTTSLSRNVKIGDSNIYNEYRVGAYSDNRKFENQLIVVPSDVQNTPGVTASEYIFSYQIYKDEFGCPNFVDNVNGMSVSSYGVADHNHDYADPSSQWTLKRNDIKKEDGSVDLYYKYYTFAPVANQKRNQAPVSQTQLTDNYYVYLIHEATDKTAYGADGYIRTIHAVKKFEKDVHNQYIFDEFDNDVKYLMVDQITNKDISDVKKISGHGANRKYNGDSTIDYFYKFSHEDLYGADWKILESVYAERYMWSRDFENAVQGLREAYIQNVSTGQQGEYLKIVPSVTDTMGYCNGVALHTIPYYNIVYVNSTGEKYYLQMLQNGTLRFEWLNTAQEEALADVSNRNYRPDLKFCFPYKMRDTGNADMIEYQSDSLGAPYYESMKVFIQSMVAPGAPKPGLVKVEAKSSLLQGSIQPDLYSIDYTKSEVALDATTWIFGDNATSNEVWIRLQAVPEDATGWLRDAKRDGSSDHFVIKTTTPTADNVKYAQLNHRADVISLYGSVDAAKLTFEFVDSTLLPGYDPKRVWYYRIKNSNGEYLTSAGFNKMDTVTPTPANSLIYKPATADAEGYAYFTGQKIANDTYYRQLFGLKKVKHMDTSKPDPFAFWVVAGVDSTKGNTKASKYYYLAGKDNLLTYRYGGGTSKQETEENAMRFLFGQTDDDKFTDIDNVDANNGVTFYGVEGGVTVENANGIVELYTVDGRLLKSVEVTNAVQTIAAPKGVVIAKNNTAIVKVVVK